MDIQETIDKSISPVYNDYENKEELRGVRCEMEKIKSIISDCENAIGSIIYMYLAHGVTAESDKTLKQSESTLLSLSKILTNYFGYLTEMQSDLETERKKYSLIFREEE